MKQTHFYLLFLLLILPHFFWAQAVEAYIEQGIENSLQLKNLRISKKLAQERTQEVNSLPNTNIGVGYFLSEPETRTGAQVAKLSVQQQFPWFGTIKARKKAREALVEETDVSIAIAKRKLRLAISKAYYQLYAYQARQRILSTNIQLIDRYEQIALKAVETDQASAVDVLRLQVRKNELHKQRDILQGDQFAAESEFYNLLNIPEDGSLQIPDSLSLAGEEPILAIEEIANHPELQTYQQQQNSLAEAKKVNAREALPNLGIGVDYIAVQERPNMNFSDNGKDIFMPMFSVSIPIFNQKYRSLDRQYDLQQEALSAQENQRKNELDSQLKKAIQARISARINYQTQQKNIQQTEKAFQILATQYENDLVDFTELLALQALQLEFQKEQIEAIKNYYQQTAIINYIKN